MTILFTDLDRTLIHSKAYDVSSAVCVEFKGDTPISYMLPEARDLVLYNIKSIVPVTTRRLSEYQRIHILDGVEWAVVGNGSTILHNNEIDKEWSSYVNEHTEPLTDEYDELTNWLNDTFDLVRPASRVEAFIFAKCDMNDRDEIDRQIFEKLNDYKNWQHVIQKNKIYLVPKAVSKEAAVVYVESKMEDGDRFTAGDGPLDVGMLDLGYRSFAPKGSYAERNTTSDVTTVEDSPHGTLSLLKAIFEGD